MDSISTIRMEEAGGEGRVDFVKQFEEDQTDPITLWQELIAARVWELFNQAFGAEFRQFIAYRAKRAFLDWDVEGFGHSGL